jgi:hypothetical protein
MHSRLISEEEGADPSPWTVEEKEEVLFLPLCSLVPLLLRLRVCPLAPQGGGYGLR